MLRSRSLSSTVAATLVAVVGVAATANGGACDTHYVQAKHKQILVLPTGGDDTANLQCALDLGATRGPGVVVQLSAGTFHTAQLVIQGLRGVVRGVSQKRTTVQNLDTPLPIDNPCIGAGPCFNQEPPSATNRYPALVSVVGEHVALSDMTFDIAGLPRRWCGASQGSASPSRASV